MLRDHTITDTGLVHHVVYPFTPQLLLVLAVLPRRDGQAELTWAAAYIQRWFVRRKTVTHPTTNRARRRVTSSIEPNALLSETATQQPGYGPLYWSRENNRSTVCVCVSKEQLLSKITSELHIWHAG